MDFVLPKGRSAVKMTSKEFDKHEMKERKRALLHLIESYLRDCNLFGSAETLANEAQLSNQYELCENIDLDIIFQDYSSYYCAKFDKYPRVIRRTIANTENNNSKSASTPKKLTRNSQVKSPNTKTLSKDVLNTSAKSAGCDLQIDVTYLSEKKKNEERDIATVAFSTSADGIEDKHRLERDNRGLSWPPPALCDFEGYTSEWREMAELITKEIVTKKSYQTGWADCVGLERCVELLKEAVVYPLVYPELFEGLLAPWRGILLYGPPGTGKTLLARALASESHGTFINLTISTFVSKWRGESEKMLKVLFDVARLYAPSTIFIDELDALASKYEDHSHDASRRFKSELLIQLDGLLSEHNGRVFVLATTNSPWNLCGAILRRFEKRIIVNVPEQEERMHLFQYYFGKHPGNQFGRIEYKEMASLASNFSGADIQLVCREAAMCALRESWSELQLNHEQRNEIIKCGKKNPKLRAPTMDDVKSALMKIRPTNSQEILNKYKDWEKAHGSM